MFTQVLESLFERLQKNGAAITLNARVGALALENVAPIQEFKARFNPGLNLIIGEHGTGKTTLLRTIAFLAGAIPEPPAQVKGRAAINLQADLSRSRKCLLIDEPMGASVFATENEAQFLEWVMEAFNGQVIWASGNTSLEFFSNVFNRHCYCNLYKLPKPLPQK